MGARTRRRWLDGSAAANDQYRAFFGRRDQGRLENGIWRRDFGNGGVAREREAAECGPDRGGTRQCARPEDCRRHSIIEWMAKIISKQCRILHRAHLRSYGGSKSDPCLL